MKSNAPAMIFVCLFFVFTTNVLSQDLVKDSIKIQKIIRESASHKNGSEILTVTDKEKVAFISNYIDAKTLERQKESARIKQTFDSTPGRRYRKGDRSAARQIVSALESGDREKVVEVMYQLNDYDFTDSPQPLYLDPEIKAELFKLVTEDKFEKRVIPFLGTNKVDGHIAFFEQRLLSGKSANNEELFFWLAQDGKSEKAIDYFISSFEKMPANGDKDTYWFIDGLGDFMKNGSAPIKKKIADFAIIFMEKNPITQADLMKKVKGSGTIGEYTSPSNPKIYFTQLVLSSDDPRVPAFADKAEAMMGKFMPPNERKELHDSMLPNLLRFYDLAKKKDAVLHSEPVKDDLMDLVNAVAKDKELLNDKAVALHLMRLFEKSDFTERYEKELFVSAISGMDRSVFESAVAGIGSAEMRKMISATYSIESKTLDENNKYLISNGLISTPVTEKQIKDGYKEDGIGDFYDHSMYSILQAAGISRSFDVEVGTYPADHDELLLDFAKGSRGKIKGLKALQQSGFDAEIQLLAVYNNKAYVVAMEDLDDWYDMASFGSLLDAIIDDSGITERFVPVETGDQTAWYIFGEPLKVKQLVKDYHLGSESIWTRTIEK